jgi:hypothetical protein
MTANVQAISIFVLIFNRKKRRGGIKLINCVEIISRLGINNY